MDSEVTISEWIEENKSLFTATSLTLALTIFSDKFGIGVLGYILTLLANISTIIFLVALIRTIPIRNPSLGLILLGLMFLLILLVVATIVSLRNIYFSKYLIYVGITAFLSALFFLGFRLKALDLVSSFRLKFIIMLALVVLAIILLGVLGKVLLLPFETFLTSVKLWIELLPALS